MQVTKVRSGNEVRHTIRLRQANNAVVNLSAATLTSSLVGSLGGTAVAALTIAPVDLANGVFDIVIPTGTVNGLTVNQTYYYDARIVHADFTDNTETFAIKVVGVATQG